MNSERDFLEFENPDQYSRGEETAQGGIRGLGIRGRKRKDHPRQDGSVKQL